MTTDRLTMLEETIAHQTRILEELSEEVAAQARTFETLERRVKLLLTRAAEAELADGSSVPLADSPPPHY